MTWAAFLVAVFPALVAAEEKPVADQAIYPLKKGAKWDWKHKNGSIIDQEVSEVVGEEVINGYICYKVYNGKSYTYYSVKDDGIYHVGGTNYSVISEKQVEYLYKPPVCILKFGGQRARTWETDSSAAFTTPVTVASGSRTYLQTVEEITVDGRRYDAVCVTSNPKDTRNFRHSIWYVPGLGPVKTKGVFDGQVFYESTAKYTGSRGPEVGAVVISPSVVEREASTEEVEKLPGVVFEAERSRTITREVSFGATAGITVEAGASGGLNVAAIKAELSAKVKAAVEAQMKEKLTDSETRKQKIKIPGEHSHALIVWIDLYKTGTVEISQDGKSRKVPFEFPYGTKLVVRKR